MNKGELIEAVANATGSTKADAGRAIDATVDSITGALKKGDTVTLIGFGTFKTAKRAARAGRNSTNRCRPSNSSTYCAVF